jgi:hypothetical protein
MTINLEQELRELLAKVEAEAKVEQEQEDVMPCPICGGEMEYYGVIARKQVVHKENECFVYSAGHSVEVHNALCWVLEEARNFTSSNSGGLCYQPLVEAVDNLDAICKQYRRVWSR